MFALVAASINVTVLVPQNDLPSPSPQTRLIESYNIRLAVYAVALVTANELCDSVIA
jgi:hypothetical protein